MKNRQILSVMAIIIAVAIMMTINPGCSTGPLTPNPIGDATNWLTQTGWTPVTYGVDENINDVIDGEEPMMKDCEKDDLYTFKPDGNGGIADNSVVCSLAHTANFTWFFPDNNPSSLNFLGQTYSVMVLDANNLVLSKSAVTATGKPTQFIYVYHHD